MFCSTSEVFSGVCLRVFFGCFLFHLLLFDRVLYCWTLLVPGVPMLGWMLFGGALFEAFQRGLKKQPQPVTPEKARKSTPKQHLQPQLLGFLLEKKKKN